MRIDRDKKMTKAEAEYWDERFGHNMPHFGCLFLDQKTCYPDNHDSNILVRLNFDLLWRGRGALPHQINACFEQNRRDGPAVKDHTAVWRQTKRDLNLTAGALSMRLQMRTQFDILDPSGPSDFDLPFVGDMYDAIRLARAQTQDAALHTCVVWVLYDGRVLFSVDILIDYDIFCEIDAAEKAHGEIARRHGVDIDTLLALYREGEYSYPEHKINRNLHRHFGDKRRHLPNNGFSNNITLLEALLDNGDLRMATAVHGQDTQGQPVLWLQDPSFTDQGVRRWAPPLWDMLRLHLDKYGRHPDHPEWEAIDMTRAKFFAALDVPEDTHA